MASFKDGQITSRPLSHRPSVSSTSVPTSMAATRQPHSRTSSHSILAGNLNGTHRVSRRKSVTNTAANVAAVAAALEEVRDRATALPIAVNTRRITAHKNTGRPAAVGSLPTPPASLPGQKFVTNGDAGDMQGSAIDDELNDSSPDEGVDKVPKSRARRASDGQPLVKDGRKSNRPEIRCEKCGKGYKHSSCLTKHLWEHTPEWAFTSKLLISKHQQVQLLEAASVLVAMNNQTNDPASPPESAQDSSSDQDSISPAASGLSEMPDRSSVDTTPPPQTEPTYSSASPFDALSNKHIGGHGLSWSYQSAASIGSSAPGGLGFAQFQQYSQDQRPTSSGKNVTGQEDLDLAQAVGLLSCSFGSNRGLATACPSAGDVPPVPALPTQYLDQAALPGSSFISSFPTGAPESFTRGEIWRGDVKMEDSSDSVMDEDEMPSQVRSDEDDDGVFGRMEE